MVGRIKSLFSQLIGVSRREHVLLVTLHHQATPWQRGRDGNPHDELIKALEHLMLKGLFDFIRVIFSCRLVRVLRRIQND